MEKNDIDLFLLDLSLFPSSSSSLPPPPLSPNEPSPYSQTNQITPIPIRKDKNIESATHPLQAYSRRRESTITGPRIRTKP